MQKSLFSIILLFIFSLSLVYPKATGVDPISQKVLPKPKNYTYGSIDLNIDDPCSISYRPQGQVPTHVYEIIGFYQTKMFKKDLIQCQKQKVSHMRNLKDQQKIIFEINIKDMNMTTAKTVQDESYQLNILNSTYWVLTADKYVGFLRGLETYSQLIEKSEDQSEQDESFQIKNTPITIIDQPDYIYRGLMIDTSRHFQPVQAILDTIDSLLYNKLNVLHWHITDADSFPFPLRSFPNITSAGSFSSKKQYSFDDIQKVISYGLFKGVQIIPEVDSPGHTLSWGMSEQFSNITLDCGGYQGQLDPTLDQTYQAVQGILKDMNEQFAYSDYHHFGGDEVDEKCWDQRPSIKTFMAQNKIPSYSALQDFYRFKQKSIWRQLSQKPAIYWANSDINVQDDDIIQWWGSSSDIGILKSKKNKIILSYYDKLYLDVGYGNRYGGSYGSMYNWDVLYSFNPRVSGLEGQILGGESCMWSEMNDGSSQSTRVWGRNSAFAERLWNVDASLNEQFPRRALLSRLVKNTQRLNRRGIAAAPVTSGVCEKNLDKCYNN